MYNNLVSYIFAFAFTTVLLAYVIKVPYLITNNTKLINEYYGKKFVSSAILDVFLFGIYIYISQFFINYFKLNNIFHKLFTVAITTILISGSFFLYFINKPSDNTFFSRWFHTVGYKAIIYDVILITFSYMVYNYLLTISINKTLV